MRKLLLFSCIVSVSAVCFAQKTLPSFGKIDSRDLQLNSCSFEPDAPAMKLFDVQESEFEYVDGNSILKTERRVRIKIFSKKGYKYANISIPYYSKKREGKIEEMNGIVYNQDASGKTVTKKLEKDDFLKEKASDNLGVVNFTFPNLQPGSIIEFRYTTIERNVTRLDPWIIQGEIPVAYTSDIVIAPSDSKIKEKPYSIDSIDSQVEHLEGDRRKNIYFKENIPSFKPEPFMSSYKDNLQKMVFLFVPKSDFITDRLTTPEVLWKVAGLRFLQSSMYGGQIKKSIPGTEKIIDSARAISSVEDRINFIYEAIKKQIPYKTEQTLSAGDIAQVWLERAGNTTEINLILLNLFAKTHITSYALLVSTRDNGKVNTDFPSIGQLNGMDVLALDTGKYYLMDASLRFQSIKNPPLNILNREALLVTKDTMQWINIADSRSLLKQNISISADMKEDGTIEGICLFQYFDYAKSYRLDSTLEEKDNEKEENVFDKKNEGLNILSVKLENAEDDHLPLLESMTFKYEPQQTGNFYFIDPQFLSNKKENPFTSDKRNTDIDFGCNQQISISLQVNFPPSFEADHVPKNITVRAPDSSFFYKRIISSDSDYVNMSQIFEIKRTLFDKEEYSAIQDFFKRMYELMAEEIVLKKKK